MKPCQHLHPKKIEDKKHTCPDCNRVGTVEETYKNNILIKWTRAWN